MGHHWLGRAAFVLSIAAMFTGIYIAAVGWGYYVAYGATLAMFLLLMAMKDVIDIFMVSMPDVGDLLRSNSLLQNGLLWGRGCQVGDEGEGEGRGGVKEGYWRIVAFTDKRCV